MNEGNKDITGKCYCGAVSYDATNIKPHISECHCSQCRKQSGHRYAIVSSNTTDINIHNEGQITWFQSSQQAERGFCSKCGSHLFWRSRDDEEMAILAASIDDTEGFRMTDHIFVEDKGAYYNIDDGLPQFIGYDTPA